MQKIDNFYDMPDKFRYKYIIEKADELDDRFKMMGFSKAPELWQYENNLKYEIENTLFFTENGNYYSAKLIKI